MITTLVQFSLSRATSREEALEVFSGTAPGYTAVEGLVRKYYILGYDCRTAGGVYPWRSRKDAESFYSADWKRFIRDRYGNEPSITYFETPVVVDNDSGRILAEL